MTISAIKTSAIKTYVLVHGAYHGGWCWQFVAELLRAQGHRVFTPTSPGLAERAELLSTFPDLDTFVTDLAELLVSQDLNDVILVGHSLGGMVALGVTDRMPERIRHLVFLDAVIMPSGAAVFDAAPSEALVFYRSLLPEHGGNGAVPVPPIDFFGLTEKPHIDFVMSRVTPHPVKTFFSRLQLAHPLGAGRPVTCIHCTKPYFRQAETSRALAKSMPGWRHIELATGHDAMITAPQDVATLLLDID